MEQALSVAKRAAREAGKIQEDYRSRGFTVGKKGETDLVTEADLACEEAIIRVIRETYPDHDTLAEEKGGSGASSPFRWLIDPLDGTTNFAHGFPVYCASVALTYGGEPLAGAVFDPTRNEMFYAAEGRGAYLNGDIIKVSATNDLISSLLATGFPYEIRAVEQNNIKHFTNFAMLSQAVRRPGAAAIDLCYVACGRLDGFWEFHLKPWDMGAGALIVAEAGGKLSASDGTKLDLYRADIVASNGHIHKAMLDTLAM
ncbi:MAG: inositol monophosphatase [Nitrospinae bacterium]|nr:inositol monophosphatase [Nitrospinota bacterium]